MLTQSGIVRKLMKMVVDEYNVRIELQLNQDYVK